jgi:DNA anti-recombination protein RmuC
MGRLRAASLLFAALAAGLLLAACGSSGNNELLPGTTADQINSNLDQVRESVNEGNCEGAEVLVAEVSTEIDALQKVDAQLKSALKQGAAKLSEVVSTCGATAAAEEEKTAEEAEAEEEQLKAEEAAAEEEAFEKEQKAEEREQKAQEKAEGRAEQHGPPEEGEESGPKGKAKGHESEETVPTPTEEETTSPSEGAGGGAGGIGPGAAVEGTP